MLACDEVNSDSIILMKSALAKCDRNKRTCKKTHEVEEMRKIVQDESACLTLMKKDKYQTERTKEGCHKLRC